MCPINGTCGELARTGCFPDGDLVLCTTSAIQYIGSTPTAILGALEPVTAVFFGVMIFGGDPHAEDMLRHPVDYHCREPDRRGEPGCGLHSAVQKTFPAASLKKAGRKGSDSPDRQSRE